MARRTSAIVFDEIKNSGLLSKRRLEVYSYIYEHGPLTGAEVSLALRTHNSVSETVRNRITELVKMGVVYEVGEVECPVTKRTVIQFDVTDRMPTEYEKPKTKNQIIKELMAENERLKQEIKNMIPDTDWTRPTP